MRDTRNFCSRFKTQKVKQKQKLRISSCWACHVPIIVISLGFSPFFLFSLISLPRSEAQSQEIMLILHCCSLKRRWAGQGPQTSRLQPMDCGCRPQPQPCHPRGRHLPSRHPGMRTGAPSSGAVTVSPQTGAHQYVAAACALLWCLLSAFAAWVCC